MTAKDKDAHRDLPGRLMIGGVAMASGVFTLSGLAGVAVMVKVLIATNTLLGPWSWQVPCFLALDLLLVVGGIWGFCRLKPWKDWNASSEPVSPATRRANRLFGLKELLGAIAMVALFFGAFSKDQPFAIFSNSPIPLWIALVAIVGWLLARVLREWWRTRADEHEREASDFGRNAATGVFLAVTPAWWVAARAGILPQPDAMALWILTMVVSSIGWSWRRYH